MPEAPYDEVPYTTLPRRETHPDRLAAIGTLFGMRPASVKRCRVLEIGCGDGGNLVPMAYHLPESSFVGIDLAAGAVDRARDKASALRLGNIDVVAGDLADIGGSEFDYILAHGLYSWVAEPVRDRLLSVCARSLSAHGIALISYNAYPGRYVRRMFREAMLYHARGAQAVEDRITRARSLLDLLSSHGRTSSVWRPMVEEELRVLLAARPGTLRHDDLAEDYAPVYFHEFASHAVRSGLQYLGDAETRLMFDPSGALEWLRDNVLEREQYLDFLFLRRFRYSLLCRPEVVLNHNPGPERIESLFFSSPARIQGDSIEGAHGVRVAARGAAVLALAGAMRDVYPFPVSFDDLVPYAGDAQTARDVLFAMVQGGFAELHAYDFPCQDSVTERPAASRLARFEAERGDGVTTACHLPATLDEPGRRLLGLLDGSRTLQGLAAETRMDPAEIDSRLEWFAQIGLLEG